MTTRADLVLRVHALIDRLAHGEQDARARDALLADALAWQREHVAAYARIAGAGALAVPTDVFRFVRVAAHAAADDIRTFRTSGTTNEARGAHHLRDLALYDHAARTAARYALFPDVERMHLVVLAPREEEAPDSSLSYMLARFLEWFGADGSTVAWRDGRLDLPVLVDALADAEREQSPVALLATSFAFVHAEEALGTRRFRLPTGSRVMQTGGFKGRAREVDAATLLAHIAERYGIDERWIVQEYGMTELSSQMYETSLRDAVAGMQPRPRRLWIPGWVRATVVDPETLAPVALGAEGILRLDDLANVDTSCAIQTSDRARAVRDGDGVVLLGRAGGATPRGCSIAVDAVRGAPPATADRSA